MKQITCPHCGDTYPDFDVAHVCSKGPYAPKLKSKMNERIRELAEQAGHRYYPSSNSGPLRVEYLTPEMVKFAELIVRECAELCLKHETFQGLFNEMEYRKGRHFSTMMKEHFGVEE